MSACVGPRPPASPLSSAMASSSAVTRQPALLQLRAQRLERGAVVFLQRRKPLQHFRREGRAGIGRGLLDQALQRIAEFLGRVDGGGDQVLRRSIRLASSFIARPPRCGARGPAACR